MKKEYTNPLANFDMARITFGEDHSEPTGNENGDSQKKKATRRNKSTDENHSKKTNKGASSGCKPGYTRHTYVLSQAMIDQVKAVAHFFSCSEVSAAEQLLQKGLDDIRKKHGKKALTVQKTQELFKEQK